MYDYTPTRSREGPELFLRDYQQGYLQAGAYAGYDFIFDDPVRKVIELLYWAHAWRKFYDARSSSPQLSHTAIAWIKLLYDVEKEIKDLSANRHDLNVFAYLKDVIARISDHPANRLGELLPDK